LERLDQVNDLQQKGLSPLINNNLLGKSTFLLQYLHNHFVEDYDPTIGKKAISNTLKNLGR